MNQSEIQSAKERALEDLRKIREEILKRDRSAKESADKLPKGESILKLKHSDKSERSSKKNKEKKSHKKHKKLDKEKYKEDVVKKEILNISEAESVKQKRSCSPEVIHDDDWMTSSVMLKTFSNNKPLPKKQCTETYEPGKSSRELNPHWKNGGSGLPSFRKPKDDYEDDDYNDNECLNYSSKSYRSSSGGWHKKTESSDKNEKDKQPSSSNISEEESQTEILTDQQMNELGAKIMKAELLNNKELAEELKRKLNSARLLREQNNAKGSDFNKIKNKTRRAAHTVIPKERARNLISDDEHILQNKFEKEKVRISCSLENAEERQNLKANVEMDDMRRYKKKINNCDKCFNMGKMNKELVVSVGKHVYLALPWHEGLQTNHCLIAPIDHYCCSTDLDEDVWQEITRYRKVLTKLFAKRKQDVLFFETARFLNKRPHMVIHCLPSDNFEMAPFYFKKAIEESEYEWSKNKQLIKLKDKNLRKSIPCGLPYFWVNFGMDFGFAHVIENQENFPSHFAQEIIAGMLTLDMKKWRSPKEAHNVKTKVKNLADLLKPYESDLA